MAFAINIALRGSQAVRSTMIAIRDTIVGSAQAEERLERAAMRAERSQRKLASAAKETAKALKEGAAYGGGGGANFATGVPAQAGRLGQLQREAGAGSLAFVRRRNLLHSIGRQGAADMDAFNLEREGPKSKGGRFAQALSRVGGAAGAVLGRISGAENGVGGLRAVALGAVAVGLAFKAVSIGMERAGKAAENVASAHASLRATIEESIHHANDAAISAAKGNRSAVLGLAGAGGDALARGQALAGRVGPGGLDAAGKLQQFGMFTERNTKALEAATKTGQITPEQFAETLTKHRGIAGGNQTADQLAAAVIRMSGNGRVDVAGVNGRLEGNTFAKRYSELDATEGDNQNRALARFAGTSTVLSDLTKEGRSISDPRSAAKEQWLKVQEDQLVQLQEIAKSQGFFQKVWLNLTTSEGSGNVQHNRAAEQLNQAANGTGGGF